MTVSASIDLPTLRESLIRGELREEFEHSVRLKLDDPAIPLDKADINKLELLMYRTWYETSLVLGPADTTQRIERALQARYVTLRARWQRYWLVRQTDATQTNQPPQPPRPPQLVRTLYDLVSDLKSAYLVSISEALGDDHAMQLWRRCDQFTHDASRMWQKRGTDISSLFSQAADQASAAVDHVGERCTAWSPVTLELYDQLDRVRSALMRLSAFTDRHQVGGLNAAGLFIVDNEAVLDGLEQAMIWEGSAQTGPGRELVAGYRGMLDAVIDSRPEIAGRVDTLFTRAA
ncbi:MAG: hypothetical protein KAS72_10135 [Phycisphaerales bacterium]|nr:hypothetical protein [Phycisphaerales bacterium]